ncbi:MAG: synthase subunit [Gammaproteobacteria bacterium]|nr:synthase subunit [Gammaproteobacteria bacterium]
MNINLTLLGQMITFAIFVWFTLKYVWPPITTAMAERNKRIADGLAAAEQGKRDLEIAHHKVLEQLRDAKVQAASLIEQATQRGNHIVEEAKEQARHEGSRLIAVAKSEIEQEVIRAKQELQLQVSELAMAMAQKILQRELDPTKHADLINHMLKEL